jgi:hypothetical protein
MLGNRAHIHMFKCFLLIAKYICIIYIFHLWKLPYVMTNVQIPIHILNVLLCNMYLEINI